ncbi:MAG: hypothetical protein WC856_07710 [Methylococcaceae bacterium]|jgi:hypothetical protein
MATISTNWDDSLNKSIAKTYDPAQAQKTGYTADKLADPNQWNATGYDAAQLADPNQKQTVAGQMTGLLSSGSPLMQQSATEGKQYAQSRGLLSSSLGAEAAQNAMIRSALPIAQQDAQTNANFATSNQAAENAARSFGASATNTATGYNADTANKFSAANQSAENTARTFDAQAANRASEFNALAKNTAGEFNAGYGQSQQKQLFDAEQVKSNAVFDANVKASLAQINNEANFDMQSQRTFGSLSQDFNAALQNINLNTNLNQQSKDYSARQLFDAYRAQISMLSAVGSVSDVSQLLSF